MKLIVTGAIITIALALPLAAATKIEAAATPTPGKAVASKTASGQFAPTAQATSASYNVMAGKAKPLASTMPLAGTAQRSLYYDARINLIGSQITRYPDTQVLGETDPALWAQYVYPNDPNGVIGFSYAFAPSGDWRYHRIYLDPTIWASLEQIEHSGIASLAAWSAAVAIMTLTHEAFHLRLYSGDERAVNACALKYFPSVLQVQFGVQPAITQTTYASSTEYKRTRHTRWVWVGKSQTPSRHRVRKVSYTSDPIAARTATTVTVDNPTYATLVAASAQFYASQPPPYNAGYCPA